jgi:DNA-binding NarL/FixJ family response regulator
MYRILIADDHPIVRRGVRSLIESLHDSEVCGEVTTGAETITQVNQKRPDLVLLDLLLPDVDGIEVLRQIRDQFPLTKVLVLSMYDSVDIVRQVEMLDGQGYVLKSDDPETILLAIECIRRGSVYFTDSAVKGANGNTDGRLRFLSPREIEVLKLLAVGDTSKQAADKLNISARTVGVYRRRIMEKLRLDSYAALIKFAVRESFVQPRPGGKADSEQPTHEPNCGGVPPCLLHRPKI